MAGGSRSAHARARRRGLGRGRSLPAPTNRRDAANSRTHASLYSAGAHLIAALPRSIASSPEVCGERVRGQHDDGQNLRHQDRDGARRGTRGGRRLRRPRFLREKPAPSRYSRRRGAFAPRAASRAKRKSSRCSSTPTTRSSIGWSRRSPRPPPAARRRDAWSGCADRRALAIPSHEGGRRRDARRCRGAAPYLEPGRRADILLFDAKPPKTPDALPGGNGLAFDWRILEGVRARIPFALAGGLTPDNVAEAIQLTGAPIVDVSSGVESAPGRKGP